MVQYMVYVLITMKAVHLVLPPPQPDREYFINATCMPKDLSQMYLWQYNHAIHLVYVLYMYNINIHVHAYIHVHVVYVDILIWMYMYTSSMYN